ncbi:MAG: asparagine synthase (glutamine-hydrolyzing) [Steroidobacteraceae bacterium]
MCGIGGFVDPHGRLSGKDLLKRLAAALAHRGPDGEGMFQEGPFGLVHRRLAIIDLSETGAQPLKVGEVAVVLNGEIYNYRELRAELATMGHRFIGSSDTEVLAHAFLEWGSSCIGRLRGMWAFAILDTRAGVLTCSRDAFGIKPFYYSLVNGAFVFASEPQALIAAGVPARAALGATAQYLAVGVTDHSRETFFAGIRQLGAGESLVVSVDAELKSLGSTDPFQFPQGAPFAPARFAACLEESIRLHLRSDVPVGTCLSGGLDSSTVAALASKELRKEGDYNFVAITGASGEQATDERSWAKLVADHCRLTWRVVQPTAAEFSAEVEDCLRIQGEPTLSPSVYFQYRVMKEAKDAGLKVMLDGQGADESLCGYDRYVPLYVADVHRRSGLCSAARECLALSRRSRRGLVGLVPLSAYVLLRQLRRWVVRSRLSLMRRDYIESALAVVGEISVASRDLTSARRSDVMSYSLPALLRYEDRNSMAHSIEARVPFVDKEVLACAFALPPEYLFHRGYSKFALRKVAATLLPPEVAWRKSKIGFEPPVSQWLAAVDERMQREVDGSSLVQSMFRRAPQLLEQPVALRWRIYSVAVWQRMFAVAPS